MNFQWLFIGLSITATKRFLYVIKLDIAAAIILLERQIFAADRSVEELKESVEKAKEKVRWRPHVSFVVEYQGIFQCG